MLSEIDGPQRRILDVFNEIKWKLSYEIDMHKDENYSDESLSLSNMFELITENSEGKNVA